MEPHLVHSRSPLPVSSGDADLLQSWRDDPAAGAALARRAHIVLLCSAGMGPSAVARELGCSTRTVTTWRERYRAEGLDGLRDAPRSGRPATVDAAAVVLRTLQPPGPGTARWSTRSLATELGISNVAVANVWRHWGIRPGAGGRVSLLTEPVLDAPLAAIAGLHVDALAGLFAVRTGHAPAPPGGTRRVGIGDRISTVAASARVGAGDPAALGSFLAALDDARAGGPIRLIAAPAVPQLIRWAEGRDGVALHTATTHPAWERLVRVACLVVGVAGGPAVEAVRTALSLYPGTGAFSWIAETAAPREVALSASGRPR
ncbi:helix-turn-helix domain-containing protein [Pseudonocardia sp. GCM10023141]|uniref:helix-turn-helix domain-containing protein n=1 Tax=Pseudonocardia sp. GCM10023141 TaxID=3252653 RepID=UPI0036127D89